MKKENKIVFIIHSLSQPRCIKRVISLQEAGFECVVYGYNRGYYDVNTFPKTINVNVLGMMENGSSRKNFITAKKNLDNIIRENGHNCIYYTFGFLASFLISFKKVAFVYEISDILYAYPKYNKIRWIMKLIDRRLINKAQCVVMTSGGFQSFYKRFDQKVLILPNKVNSSLIKIKRNILDTKSHCIRFAFIGAIRYNSIFRFAQTIGERFPNHEFHFYGGAPQSTLNRVHALTTKYKNVILHGPFKSPEDLPQIYYNVDVVVACYDTNSLNECIAEPNKLYESILFCRPIVVSKGTYLADRVAKYKCGFSIDPSSSESIYSFLQALNFEELRKISYIEQHTDVKEVVNDATELVNTLKGIVRHG